MVEIFRVPNNIPLMGTVYFGIIDRGTNVIQIRPSTQCPLSCIFCSTDAGPSSRRRRTEYLVELEHLMAWTKEIVRVKGEGVEAHIDTVGDPLTYKDLINLVQGLRELKEITNISMQTHGHLLNERVLEELGDAGLSRINLSIDAINPLLAKKLAGNSEYDVTRIIDLARYTTENTPIDLLIAPVWVHPINDLEMEKLIKIAKETGAGKSCPPLGIQKCEFHKHGRRTKEMKFMTWHEFYRQLRELEMKTNTKLILKASDFGIKPARSIKSPYHKRDRLKVKVVGPGWFKGESLAVTRDGRWALTIIGSELPEDEEATVRLLRTKDNILVGALI
ncbi:MAG: radical SAM protein [Candidatus Methanomethylicaceae archaeon]